MDAAGAHAEHCHARAGSAAGLGGRARAVYNCTKYFGENYSQGGKKECDEYPFATTYEGAAGSDYDSRQDPKNFSVMPVAKTENGAAGTLLGQYYKLNRLIDGPDDGFMVKVRS
ncbi:hypothetical protein [Streptomyces sp. PBH53]|uniref:NucA/NucB deoxyribonuclease domain-containing protein n=1 Tax=Streptomyces sp. PBH53 TaxID=1577075 RepID=UPI001C9CE9F4|nr:hypothetical protein [Streptomyces sp. PBH53]